MANFGKVVVFVVLLSNAVAEISRPSQLSCDFSDDFCDWRNVVAIDQQDWFREERVASDPFNSIPRGVNGLGDVFAYVRGGQGLQEAWLASDAIPCQRSQGMVAFALWKSSISPSLEVCIRQPPNAAGTLSCIARFDGHVATEWVARFVITPPNPKPFQIVFRATFFNPFDIIAIDKVVYEAAQLCSS
uniref:MAM domain-containing protein n=1 Tax=Plectus sambesii TaxID=2011161 RepID=A0A914WX03_9BILA